MGRAANYAAKLTELNLTEASWITKDVYDKLHESAKQAGEPKRNMWKSYRWNNNGDLPIYGSNWTWAV